MARVEGGKVFWTWADLAALENDKELLIYLINLINQVTGGGAAEVPTPYQDPCSAFVRLTVANAPPPDGPALKPPPGGPPSSSQTLKKGTVPARDKKGRTR